MYEKVHNKILTVVIFAWWPFLITVFKNILLFLFPPCNTHTLLFFIISIIVCDLYSTFLNYNYLFTCLFPVSPLHSKLIFVSFTQQSQHSVNCMNIQ